MTRTAMALRVALCLVLAGVGARPVEAAQTPPPSGAAPCDDAGLSLPTGFCATVFADNLGHVRHLVLAPNGVLYANTWSGSYFHNDQVPPAGFLIALTPGHDATAGKAASIERFGDTPQTGGTGGTGIAWYHDYLYAESHDRIVRYHLGTDDIVPHATAETVVSGLPLTGDHPMHPLAIDADGNLYVDVASATNACQHSNRSRESAGISPCTELQTRGGIWRYDANQIGQVFSASARYATGLRNAEGLSFDADGRTLFATQHGRDQLSTNWPKLYTLEQGAILPAEELVRVVSGGDYGWPECYFDQMQAKLVLAPEYGGDGGKSQGVCADKLAPLAAFPAHWAPNDMQLYAGTQFPARYRGGAFIAFHGSWNRAPFAQDGYNVVFQPLQNGRASGPCEIFADGFAGPGKAQGKALQRPTGLAFGADGALYIADDVHGRIYRVTYEGNADDANAHGAPCPSPDASPGPILTAQATPPEGTHPNAGATATVGLAPGASHAMLDLGNRIYHGQVGGAPCTGCHGIDGRGTPVGPDLTGGTWAWNDGSVDGIAQIIARGVPQPKAYRGAMPAMGGAQLDDEQLHALATYVWGLGHSQ